MWISPEDNDPTMLQYPTRKCASVFGAVNIRTGEFVGMVSNVFNTITFVRFLTTLMKRGKKMQFVLDNARYHNAKLIHHGWRITKINCSLTFCRYTHLN